MRKKILNDDFADNGSVRFDNISGSALQRVLAYCEYEWTEEVASRFGSKALRGASGRPIPGYSSEYSPPPKKAKPAAGAAGAGAGSGSETAVVPAAAARSSTVQPPDEPFALYIQHANPAVLCELASVSPAWLMLAECDAHACSPRTGVVLSGREASG